MNTGLSEARIAALSLDPTQPARLYAVTDTGVVFRSTDSAATWQRQGQLPAQ